MEKLVDKVSDLVLYDVNSCLMGNEVLNNH